MPASQLAPSVAPIERQSLHELVANRVRDMIIEGQLAPGAQVNESRLCMEMGVSRTPMREAIRTLASEGLIVLRPGRSTVVRKFTRDDIRGMLEVLAELEALAGRQACSRADDTAIAAIRQAHDQMIRYYRAGERLPYYKLNQQIHSMIVDAGGNAALAEVHGTLQARMKRTRFVGNDAPENWQGAVAEHEEMMAALECRDADRLAGALRLHLHNTWDRVVNSL